MLLDFSRRRIIVIWQTLFLIFGTIWLWAPYLNPSLSYRLNFISDYEAVAQPYSWLLRTGDLLASLLLAGLAIMLLRRRNKLTGLLLLLASVCLFADPILITSCKQFGAVCREDASFATVLHDIETIFTSGVFLFLAVYDAIKRGKLASVGFSLCQAAFIALLSFQLVEGGSFAALIEYGYEASLVVWLAWYGRDLIRPVNFETHSQERRIVKNLVALWAFLNGIAAIVLSLAHINLFGRLHGLYFAGDTAWLAQHGIIVGVVMLYLSRHLARGEERARQIFLALSGIEALKYAVITPNAALLLFYVFTFVALFVLRDDFDRGTAKLNWTLRLRDAAFMVGGLFMATLLVLLMLDSDSKLALVTSRALQQLPLLPFLNGPIAKSELASTLLAQSFTVLVAASIGALLWVLFRPVRIQPAAHDHEALRSVLERYSNSTEDYFKLWPAKNYYWNRAGSGFVAYKIAGSYAFALADPMGLRRQDLLRSFIEWAHEHRLKVCFLPITPKSLAIYQSAGLKSMQIGASAVIDIEKFLDKTVREKWWRWRLNKAEKSGYAYHVSSPPHNGLLLQAFEQVSNEWLGTNGRQEHGFALGYFSQEYIQNCTVHYVTDQQGKVIAFANELPTFRAHGSMTVDLLRVLPETDAMPYLLSRVMEGGRMKYRTFDLGFVPFAATEGPFSFIAKALMSSVFSAAGLARFKNKFDPTWVPNYLAYDGDLADLPALGLALEKVLSYDEPAPDLAE